MPIKDFHKQITLPGVAGHSRNSSLPQKIGPYKIESLLNKGGMSYLYLGVHPTTGQPIVIKVLSPKFIANPEIAARFLKEAQIIGLTDHPNIIKLYGQGTWEKGLYIVMEFIQGISLRQFIQQKSLSQKRALEIVLQVAYALCHFHTHGVIHRDLKPENILITETGEIKVIDFGIAQLQEDQPDPLTKNRPFVGTPVYMSPEQKKDPASVSYTSDIYSLGIIAYELFLGRLSHGVIHLSLLPEELKAIIEKTLKPDPKERTQDIVDFITDISHLLKSWEVKQAEPKETCPEEFLNLIKRTKSLLMPQKAPRWTPIEIGIAIQEGSSLSGFYLDTFRLPDNRFCLILAEPMETGVISLLYASTLRGMVRMAIHNSFLTGKKDLHPINMLNSINLALLEDPLQHKFKLSLLILNPDKDTLSFVSCGYLKLLAIPDGSKTTRLLSTPNPFLGGDPKAVFLETADNFHSGDLLVLTTFTDYEPIPNQEELLLSPQALSERFLKRLIGQESQEKTSAVVSLQRIF